MTVVMPVYVLTIAVIIISAFFNMLLCVLARTEETARWWLARCFDEKEARTENAVYYIKEKEHLENILIERDIDC